MTVVSGVVNFLKLLPNATTDLGDVLEKTRFFMVVKTRP